MGACSVPLRHSVAGGADGTTLTLDAEAELLLLVGDVAGDGPDERHGQGAGDAGDRPRLRHRACWGAERARCCAAGGGGRAPPPLPPHRRPRGGTALVPTSAVVAFGAAPGTCKRREPISGPVPLRSPHHRAGQPGRERARRGRAAAWPQGHPWPGGVSVSPPWGMASLLPHASAWLPRGSSSSLRGVGSCSRLPPRVLGRGGSFGGTPLACTTVNLASAPG